MEPAPKRTRLQNAAQQSANTVLADTEDVTSAEVIQESNEQLNTQDELQVTETVVVEESSLPPPIESDQQVIILSENNQGLTNVCGVDEILDRDGTVYVSSSHHTDNQTGQMIIDTMAGGDEQTVEVIQVSSLEDLHATNADQGKVWQILPSNLNITADSVIIVGENNSLARQSAGITDSNDLISGLSTLSNLNMSADTPVWARQLRDCEKIGHYYRGWVVTEQELDIVMTLHKQQTHSFWGTRQSPAGNRPSARMMWKSQYVPFDGIPFINCGSRAVVMECQFGPRRKGGALPKKIVVDGYKHCCPARIYIKKVRKFPEFRVMTDLDKKSMKIAMDKSFASLRMSGFASGGSDRFYVQLPTEHAHEFHLMGESSLSQSGTIQKSFSLTEDSGSIQSHRLAPEVSEKIRDLVSRNVRNTTNVRKLLRKYVEKELFCDSEVPARHNLSYFPTVNDLQNHIHMALTDIENGTIPLQAPLDIEMIQGDSEVELLEEWGRTQPVMTAHPETVTVTLTQNPDEDGHVISKVETHMSDGSTRISSSLTPETAQLLARLHPNMFPSIQTVMNTSKGTDGEKITQMVHSVLSQPTQQDLQQSVEERTNEQVEASSSNVPVQPTTPTGGETDALQAFESLQESHVVTMNDVQMTE